MGWSSFAAATTLHASRSRFQAGDAASSRATSCRSAGRTVGTVEDDRAAPTTARPSSSSSIDDEHRAAARRARRRRCASRRCRARPTATSTCASRPPAASDDRRRRRDRRRPTRRPPSTSTSSSDLFDDETRKGLRNVIRGHGAASTAARATTANAGWEYLNPSLVAARRLFRELDLRHAGARALRRRTRRKLVTDVADRRDDLAALVDQLADTTGAIAREEDDLRDGDRPAAAVHAPREHDLRRTCARRSTTSTRSSRRPSPVDAEAAPRARRAAAVRPRGACRPSATSSTLVRRPGEDNDLHRARASRSPPFRDIADRPGAAATARSARARSRRRPKSLQGPDAARRVLPARTSSTSPAGSTTSATRASTTPTARPAASRTSVNAFAAVGGAAASSCPQELRDELVDAVAARGQNNRCPGSIERPAERRLEPVEAAAGLQLRPDPDPAGRSDARASLTILVARRRRRRRRRARHGRAATTSRRHAATGSSSTTRSA